MRSKVLSIAVGLLVAGALIGFSEAAASECVDSDMLVTESAVPVAEGAVNIEVGMTYSKANDGKRTVWTNNWAKGRRGGDDAKGVNTSFRMYEWDFTATMGVAPDTDVSISTGWVDMYDRGLRALSDNAFYGGAHARGMDDLTVSLKRRVVDDGGLSVAVIPGLTIPTGRHTRRWGDVDREGRWRLGPGQNFWSLDTRVAVTQDLDALVLNADLGYSLPFGRTRRSYMRDYAMHTDLNARGSTDRRGKRASERGILDANVGAIYAEGPVRPLVELNYAHRWISRGNDSDLIYATVGGVVALDDDMPRIKVGYQHPVAGRNAARARKFLLSMAYAF